jgi:hypothetical protein
MIWNRLTSDTSVTTVLAHSMSTSSLFLTVLNGRVSPLLDVWVLLTNFSTSVTSSECPLSNDLFTTSLTCILSSSSLSFRSLTTWSWRSMYSGYGLLFVTLVRDRTFQEIIGLHFYYCCMVVLWTGRIPSGVLRHTWRRHFCVSLVLFEVIFNLGFLFLRKKNSFGLGKGVSTQGVKEGRKGTKKKINFFHYTYSSPVNVHTVQLYYARVVPYVIPDSDVIKSSSNVKQNDNGFHHDPSFKSTWTD